jgi:hypothetical protein
MDDAPPDDPRDRGDRRLFLWSVLGGIAVGAAHGIPKYGVFSIGNVALIGLGVIAVVGIVAGVIALLPARPAE